MDAAQPTVYDMYNLPQYIDALMDIVNLIGNNGLVHCSLNFQNLYDNNGALVPLIGVPAHDDLPDGLVIIDT